MKPNEPFSGSPQTPKFKTLRPAPPDSPIYRRGYLVGAVVLGKKSPATTRRASAPEKGTLPEEQS